MVNMKKMTHTELSVFQHSLKHTRTYAHTTTAPFWWWRTLKTGLTCPPSSTSALGPPSPTTDGSYAASGAWTGGDIIISSLSSGWTWPSTLAPRAWSATCRRCVVLARGAKRTASDVENEVKRECRTIKTWRKMESILQENELIESHCAFVCVWSMCELEVWLYVKQPNKKCSEESYRYCLRAFCFSFRLSSRLSVI